MPNFFTLTRKSNPEAGPVDFVTIDEEICAHCGVTPDPDRYLDGWYDSIGFRLAFGKSWDEIRKDFSLQAMEANERDDGAPYSVLMHRLMRITDWLEERFEAACGFTRIKG